MESIFARVKKEIRVLVSNEAEPTFAMDGGTGWQAVLHIRSDAPDIGGEGLTQTVYAIPVRVMTAIG